MMNRYETPTILMIELETKDILTVSDRGLYDESNDISFSKLSQGLLS